MVDATTIVHRHFAVHYKALTFFKALTHAALDLGVGVATLAASALLKKSSREVHITLLLMGLTGIVVGTLSIAGAKNS